MTCNWGHPIGTLPSDGGDYTLFSQNNENSANQGPPHKVLGISIVHLYLCTECSVGVVISDG
eukprot:5757821-Pleurochrysis_carterae.AAC.1